MWALNGLWAVALASKSVAGALVQRQEAENGVLNKGGLTILSYNDLTNNPTRDSAAVLVHETLEYASTLALCQELDEGLWDPDTGVIGHGLNSSLSYQVFQMNFGADQLFWVAKPADSEGGADGCRAINSQGDVTEIDCAEQLPGLCSQSAPVSTVETNDQPTDFHIDHPVGDSVYTGFRDFFVWKFRGVRYAAQPERFEHSTVYEATGTDAIPALKAGADCLQPIGEVQEGMSEDCFFLNIWTPWLPPAGGAPPPKLKPVMFYIYGGGFTSGSGKNPNTDGTNIASRGDVVAVSTNYRVSSLGHLNFNDGTHNGNYGLGDIITALEWVKAHITDFGGDPGRVTIYGESAGALAVRALLASPKAQGLFANAISQSGPAGLVGNEHGLIGAYDSLEHDYEATTTRVLEETGCAEAQDAVACLRDYNATALVNLAAIANGLLVDGTYLNATSLPLDGTGLTSDVVYMTGTNRNELGVEFDMPPDGATVTDVVEGLASRFGIADEELARLVGTAAAAFPVPADMSPADLLNLTIRMGTDSVYTCAEQATAYSAVHHGAFEAVYSFMFNRTYNPAGYTKPHCGPPATDAFPDGDPSLEYFKCHAGEQMIVFGTIQRDGLPDRDGLDVPFMQLVVDYWTTFARNRNPNPTKEYLEARGYLSTLDQLDDVGPWNAATAEEPNLRLLQWDGRHINLTETDQCDALGLPLDLWEKQL